MNNTEPIGFLGTRGEWKCEYNNDIASQFYFVDGPLMKAAYVHTDLLEQVKANVILMAASKKMAIALQELLEYTPDTAMLRKVRNKAQETLKQAGL